MLVFSSGDKRRNRARNFHINLRKSRGSLTANLYSWTRYSRFIYTRWTHNKILIVAYTDKIDCKDFRTTEKYIVLYKSNFDKIK